MKFVGHDVENVRMEIMELENHPYYVAVQYHPEYISLASFEITQNANLGTQSRSLPGGKALGYLRGARLQFQDLAGGGPGPAPAQPGPARPGPARPARILAIPFKMYQLYVRFDSTY